MNNEGKFISHEEGPIKYVEMSSEKRPDYQEAETSGEERAEYQEMGEKTLEATRASGGERSLKKKLARIAIRGLATVAAIAALAGAAAGVNALMGEDLDHPKPNKSQPEWEVAMQGQLDSYPESEIFYSEDGSRVVVDYGGNRYYLDDLDNDSKIDRGERRTQGGDIRKYDSADGGTSVAGAIDKLDQNIPR